MVLSLFPGIGLLDRAFELEGFCVVRGPDVIWGGDVREFHPPLGRFDGIIGGPPCQDFSGLANLVRAKGHEPVFGNLIPEFERVVAEAKPDWFLMENVRAAPIPKVTGYHEQDFLLNNTWLGEEQMRLRRFTFGLDGRAAPNLRKWIPGVAIELLEQRQAVSGRHESHGMGGDPEIEDGNHAGNPPRYSLAEMLALQGLPADFLDHCPFTVQGKRKAIGNGVPIPMGRAVAQAIAKALQ